jgi:hypothetical protein
MTFTTCFFIFRHFDDLNPLPIIISYICSSIKTFLSNFGKMSVTVLNFEKSEIPTTKRRKEGDGMHRRMNMAEMPA